MDKVSIIETLLIIAKFVKTCKGTKDEKIIIILKLTEIIGYLNYSMVTKEIGTIAKYEMELRKISGSSKQSQQWEKENEPIAE